MVEYPDIQKEMTIAQRVAASIFSHAVTLPANTAFPAAPVGRNPRQTRPFFIEVATAGGVVYRTLAQAGTADTSEITLTDEEVPARIGPAGGGWISCVEVLPSTTAKVTVLIP